jgi:hypothetical protein
MPYTDRELEAMDRAAADRLGREDFARLHHEWSEANDWAASIVMAPFAALQRAAAKADARRFDGSEPITGFGALEHRE